MGLGGQKSNQDTTTEGQTIRQEQGGTQDQRFGYGGQYTGGQHGGQTDIQYLDPAAITEQQDRYRRLLGSSGANTEAANAAAGGFYSGLLDSPGYSNQVKDAISQTSNDAVNEKLAEAKYALARHGAATGNDAGFAGATSRLFGTAAQEQAARTRENQIDFANEQQRQKELGGAGMERLLGVNQAAQLGLMGQSTGLSTLRSGESTTGYDERLGLTGQGSEGQSTFANQGQTDTRGHTATSGSQTGANLGSNDTLGGLSSLLDKLFGKKDKTDGGGGSPVKDSAGRTPNDPKFDWSRVPGAVGNITDRDGHSPGDPNFDWRSAHDESGTDLFHSGSVETGDQYVDLGDGTWYDTYTGGVVDEYGEPIEWGDDGTWGDDPGDDWWWDEGGWDTSGDDPGDDWWWDQGDDGGDYTYDYGDSSEWEW